MLGPDEARQLGRAEQQAISGELTSWQLSGANIMEQISRGCLRRLFLLTVVVSGASVLWAYAQAQAPSSAPISAPPAASNLGLKQYVLPDHTASAMLPPDWRVVQTGLAFISAQGPNGEIAMFGVLVPAHDGSTTSITPTVLNQPYTASPKEKFTQSLNWVRARSGKAPVPIDFKSQAPIADAPKAFGQCDKFTALVGAQGQLAMEADQCSMPVDSSGNYKNFFKVVAVSAAQARAERPALEAILASYQLNPTAIQKAQQSGAVGPKGAGGGSPAASAAQAGGNSGGSALTWAQAIAQVNAMHAQFAATTAQANAINRQTMAGMAATNNAVNNFDMGVLRGDTPVYAVGQSNPLFWIGN
jgi:hypothetical protein